MSYGEALTISQLIDLIGNQKQCFSNNFIPLSHNEVTAIRRCSAYIAQPRDPKKRNLTKKRIHSLLTDIWTHEPTVFVLCALATYPTKLPSLDGASCLRMVLKWWQGTDHPQGLLAIVESYSHILPGGNEVASKSIAIPQKRHSGLASNSDDDNRRKRVRIHDNASMEVTDGVENLGHDADGFQRERGADGEAPPETLDSHELEISGKSIETSTASESPIIQAGLVTGTSSTNHVQSTPDTAINITQPSEINVAYERSSGSINVPGFIASEEIQFITHWPIGITTDVVELYQWRTKDAVKTILPVGSLEAAKDRKPAYSDKEYDFYYASLEQAKIPCSLIERIRRSKRWQDELEQRGEMPADEYCKSTCLTIGLKKDLSGRCIIFAVVDGCQATKVYHPSI